MLLRCWSYLCVVRASIFFFQAEDGIRDLVRSRGLGDVYKRQGSDLQTASLSRGRAFAPERAMNAAGIG